jgi:hypothetical protein
MFEMYEEICLGLIIIISIILILYFLTRSKGPVSVEKKIVQGNIKLIVKANDELAALEVKGTSEGNDEISFVRRDLKKDEIVEFIFPQTQNPISMVVRDSSGIHKIKV